MPLQALALVTAVFQASELFTVYCNFIFQHPVMETCSSVSRQATVFTKPGGVTEIMIARTTRMRKTAVSG